MFKNCLKLNLSGEGVDLGCGIGVIGITISHFNPAVKFTFIDVNKLALSLTKINLQTYSIEGNVIENNGLENIEENSKDFIITNPPIRAGKAVIYKFYEDSFKVLKKSGKLVLVIRKQQGAESTQKKLMEIFKNCTVLDKSKGYFIYLCQK